METLKLIGAIIVLIGSVFLFLGSLGMVRMPDLYNRIQAGTKASTLGTILTLAGIIFLSSGGWVGKLVILILFVLITNPISSHILAKAAHSVKVKLTEKSVTDQLADDEELLNQKSE